MKAPSLHSLWLVALAFLLLAGQRLRAEEAPSCPPWEPPMLRGLQVRTSLGTGIWVGEVGKASRPGLALVFGADYEFFPWLAVEASYSLGFNGTDQDAPPTAGNFTTQAFHAGPRLTLPLDPFDLFLRGGVGWMGAQPDILVRIEKFDGKLRFGWMGGLGFLYHTPRRRVFVGFEASVLGAIDFPGYLLVCNAVLGVTLL
jgi:hypothetical protein